MYEQYTDKQIVEMLKPKLAKLGWGDNVTNINIYPSTCKMIATIYRSGYIRGQLGRSFIIGEKKIDEKKAKESVNPFKVGDKVKFFGLNIEDEEALNNCFVQWPKGITSGDGTWGCQNAYLEKVTEHWVPSTRGNVKVGSKVRMIDEEAHKDNPRWVPNVGTVGIVIDDDPHVPLIQWPSGTTSKDDRWFCSAYNLEVLLCE